jgi:hypothetical protein
VKEALWQRHFDFGSLFGCKDLMLQESQVVGKARVSLQTPKRGGVSIWERRQKIKEKATHSLEKGDRWWRQRATEAASNRDDEQQRSQATEAARGRGNEQQGQ